MELQDTAQRIAYALDEGEYKHEGKKLSQLGEVEVGEFENQIYKDDFIEFSPNLDECVKKAESGPAIGVIISTPWGNIPLENTSFEDVEHRHATINVFSQGEYDLALSDTNLEIGANKPLVITKSDGKLNLSTDDNTNAIALEEKGPNSGGYIKVFVTGPITVV